MDAARHGKWTSWRKSSHSSGTSGNTNCVEVAWRKSDYSSGTSGNTDCVEVAVGPARVGVRDSKSAPGPNLTFPIAHWRTFLTSGSSKH